MDKGIIVKNVSNLYYIKSNGEIFECSARGKFKNEDISPIVGDKVEIEIIDRQNRKAVIEKIQDRENYIRRPKVANISNLVFVISSKLPKPDLLMLDKQLAFAEFMNIEPIIIINKIDLDEKTASEIFEEYSKIGYKVISTSIINNIGVKKIFDELNNSNNSVKVLALAGNSGVGKSSLINALSNGEITKEGEISKKNKRGKNTTTITSLYEISENIFVIDTPGFSTFDITEIESRELSKYFIEFRQYLDECEFQGCSHIKEENCGIKNAIKNEKISCNRYERYIKIYEDLKYKEDHKKW